MKVTYILEMERPQTHFFHVIMKVEDFAEDSVVITMPVWTPGSYHILDFARHVRKLKASDNEGRQITVSKKDKSSWKLSLGGSRSFAIDYEIYADELSVHTSHLDSSHGYLNGTSVFMYIEGYKDQTVELLIKPHGDWRVSTGLEKIGENRYRATNYDILADCPIEIGNHRSLFFSVNSKEHEIVLYGQGNEDEGKLVSDIRKIVEYFASMFGQLPYKRYVFIFHIIPQENIGGGLEHLNSTTIDIDSFHFAPSEKYHEFLSVVSHEFFHLWNVKRIRPIELGPFNYKEENYTTLLWMSEGFTNFYGSIALYRAGLVEEKEYLKHLMENIRFYEMIPGTKLESAADSSFDSWVKLYKPSPNNINSYVSYYLKGEILGAMLNRRIIENTDGNKSLDDVFRVLFEKFNKDGKGFTEKDLLSVLKEVSGADFSEFFSQYVRSAERIDFKAELKAIGYSIKKSYKKVDNEEPAELPYLGILVKHNGGHYVVDSVVEGSPAYFDGVNSRDELVAINGYRFTERFLKPLRENSRRMMVDNISIAKPGDKINLHLFRMGKLKSIDVNVGKAPPELYEAEPDLNPTEKVMLYKEKFMKG